MFSTGIILALVLASTLFALMIIDRERDSLSKRSAHHVTARQSSHVTPTPRVGGVAIAVGILSGALLSGNDAMGLLLWTTLPIFLVGLLEDLGPDTPPSLRLGVAAVSAILAVLVLGAKIDRLSISLLDPVFAVPLIAAAFTVFASVGMTHAMNLIDGLNGLSSAIAIAIMAAFAAVAHRFGHADLVLMNLIIITAFLGFMAVNFPFGRIFLGDAGAYSVGHLIAWNAILLLTREPQVSAWGILLILLWPVLDTVFAMARRAFSGQSISEPDRLHFHHVAMRLTGIYAGKTLTRKATNPIGSALTWPLAWVPCALGVYFITDTASAMMCVGLFSLLYGVTLLQLIRRARGLRNLARG